MQVGVCLDEPLGLHDGTVKGVRLFDAAPGFGTCVRGKNVRVGSFPERSLLDEDEECCGFGDEAGGGTCCAADEQRPEVEETQTEI